MYPTCPRVLGLPWVHIRNRIRCIYSAETRLVSTIAERCRSSAYPPDFGAQKWKKAQKPESTKECGDEEHRLGYGAESALVVESDCGRLVLEPQRYENSRCHIIWSLLSTSSSRICRASELAMD